MSVAGAGRGGRGILGGPTAGGPLDASGIPLVVFTAPDQLSRLVGRRLLQPLNFELIPNLERNAWPELHVARRRDLLTNPWGRPRVLALATVAFRVLSRGERPSATLERLATIDAGKA